MSTTTDENGAFDFSGASVAVSTQPSGASSRPFSFGVKGDHLLLANPGAAPMRVSLYNVQGRLVHTVESSKRTVRVRAGTSTRQMIFTAVDGRVIEGAHRTLQSKPAPGSASSETAHRTAQAKAAVAEDLVPLLFYVRAASDGFFEGYAVSRGTTARDLAITLIDSSAFSGGEPCKNPALPLDKRVEDMVSRMSKSEQVSLLSTETPRIEHPGIPEANWWQECLCGPRRKTATVTPTSLHLAATWNEHTVKRADISLESGCDLPPGETQPVSLTITPYQLTVVREDAKRYIEPGAFTVFVGGGQPVARTPSNVLEAGFTVTGQEKEITRGHL